MRKLVFLMLLLLVALPAAAQDFTVSQTIELVPFMVENLNVQGLRPRLWHEQSGGVFLRARDAVDLTAILMQSREGNMADLLEDLTTEFGLAAAPEILETLATEHFTWTLYQFERQQSNQTLTVDVAFAEDTEANRVYYILTQTTAMFHEELRAELFLPAVQALSPVQRYVDPQGRFDVPIPTLWLLEERENYAVLHDHESTILIYVSAVEGDNVLTAMQDFWLSIYPDFSLTIDPATDIQTISDPRRIGGLEMVYILNWESGEDAQMNIKQGVARVYNGVIYMTLIETTSIRVLQHDDAIAMVDNNYRVTELLPEATPEATQNF